MGSTPNDRGRWRETETAQQLLACSLAVGRNAHTRHLRLRYSLGEFVCPLDRWLAAVVPNANGDILERQTLDETADGDVVSSVENLTRLLRDQITEVMHLALERSMAHRSVGPGARAETTRVRILQRFAKRLVMRWNAEHLGGGLAPLDELANARGRSRRRSAGSSAGRSGSVPAD